MHRRNGRARASARQVQERALLRCGRASKARAVLLHAEARLGRVDEILGDYRGYLVADAHSVCDHLYRSGEITEVACWAHARRYFLKALDSDPERAKEALAKQARADCARVLCVLRCPCSGSARPNGDQQGARTGASILASAAQRADVIAKPIPFAALASRADQPDRPIIATMLGPCPKLRPRLPPQCCATNVPFSRKLPVAVAGGMADGFVRAASPRVDHASGTVFVERIPKSCFLNFHL